jgi:hypothetical protein
MYAITICQPYASLIINGWKLYELRNWLPPHDRAGERIAIHAANRQPLLADIVAIINDPLAVCLGAPLVPAMDAYEWGRKVWPDRQYWKRSGLLGTVLGTAKLGEPVKTETLSQGGRIEFGVKWAWPMLDIEKFEEPVPAKGSQRFWTWERPPQAVA